MHEILWLATSYHQHQASEYFLPIKCSKAPFMIFKVCFVYEREFTAAQSQKYLRFIVVKVESPLQFSGKIEHFRRICPIKVDKLGSFIEF